MNVMQLRNKIVHVKNLKKHAKSIVCIIKDSYEEDWLIGSIYTSPLVKYYVESLVSSEIDLFYCIFIDNVMVAFLHIKDLDDCYHINNIAVKKKYYGCGYGTALLYTAIDKSILYKKKLRLHVDSRNNRAFLWYLNNSFLEIAKTDFSLLKSEKPFNLEDIDKCIVVDDIVQFKRFGFSFAHLYYEGFKRKIGLICPSYIKIIDSQLLSVKDIFDIHKFVNCNLIIPGKLMIGDGGRLSNWSVFTMEYDHV